MVAPGVRSVSEFFREAVVKRLLFALIALASLLTVGVSAASAATFVGGVASGDVTSSRAILLAHTDVADQIHVRVWDNPSLSGPKAAQGKVKTTAERGFAAKVDVSGLAPNTTYYYRFDKDEVVSDVGTFKTAPDPSTPANVKATYTGDWDGTHCTPPGPLGSPCSVAGAPVYNNFPTLAAAQAENGDFFIADGDTIYSDSRFRATPATTLPEYRAAQNEALAYPNLKNILESTSTIATMDDHEVKNDYDSVTVNPAQYAAGREAFLESYPVRETGLPHDPSCVGDPLYRSFHWGADVDVFVLDERSCRSQESAVTCLGDLAPTLPPAARQVFPFNLFLTPNPPPGCLASINSSARTLLGPVQKAQFESDLQNSTATYKYVVSQDPIQQFFVAPYDRWEGYAAERSQVLNFIQNNGIDNVLFLTTDTHATLQNQVAIDQFTNPTPIANEMVTGPVATDTFQTEVLRVAGGVGLFAVNTALNAFTGMDCRNLNQNSYALVETTSGGSTTITSKTDTGVPVVGVNTRNAPSTCTGTYGP
jgi:alkaline phosphatase D